MAKVEAGLSAQRIYRDLVEESGLTDSYQSVKRFVRKRRSIQPDRVWRLECQQGEELQLDSAWEHRSMTLKVRRAAVGYALGPEPFA